MEQEVTIDNLIVVKRDGREVKYDDNKVFQALFKAFLKVYKGKNEDITAELLSNIQDLTEDVSDYIEEQEYTRINVEDVQDIVMDILLDSDFNDVAKEYIQYSERRKQARLEQLDVNLSVSKVDLKDPDVVNENGNKDSRTFKTQRDMTAGQVSRAVGLSMMPKKVANGHIKGDIYWHKKLCL